MDQQSEVAPGTILAGKYRVDRVLGAGGMGVVVAAHHLHLDERVAIKMLLPEMLGNREAVERFAREARAAVKIKSEHVARVSDVGSLENGAPFMVMEYLEGEDLGEWLAKRGPLPVQQAVEFVLQACEALAEAHSLGIVHRDLKPANLYCIRRSDGLLAVKVLDFGISKVGGLGGDMGMTKTTAVMGSPYYMSPEQMASAKTADAQSDIWSLGAVLFELLSGSVPFQAETLTELIIKVTSTPAPDLVELRADVPEGLRAVVGRCLERDKSRRYRDISELALALSPFGPERARASVDRVCRILQAAGLSQALPEVSQSSAQVDSETRSTSATGTIAAFGHTSPEVARSRRTGLYAAVASVLIVGGLGATVLLLGGNDAEDTPVVQAGTPDGTEVPPAASVTPVVDPPSPEPLAAEPKEQTADEPSESEKAQKDETTSSPTETKPSQPAPSPRTTQPVKPKPRPAKPPEPPSSTPSKSPFGGRL